MKKCEACGQAPCSCGKMYAEPQKYSGPNDTITSRINGRKYKIGVGVRGEDMHVKNPEPDTMTALEDWDKATAGRKPKK